ncbi:MAG TPA: hypothetical protein VFX64_05865 [Candidatus Nitrosotalea sp.]|nr:hypothetical protein [Candidatus Nitrosotalea sp.]
MKISHISIILIGIVIGIIAVLYAISYDSTPVTKENDFGINALVIHRPPGMACPTIDCHFSDYHLKINSNSKTFITGYNICDGNSCTKKDVLLITLPVVDVIHPNYQEIPLPDNLPWKDGDFVNIKVKAPSTLIMGITNSSIPTIWIDLGKSEIVRSS